MKLDMDANDSIPLPKPKKEKKSSKKSKKETQAEDNEAVLKKPRTRSVSLTLSENGINEELAELPMSEPKKKSKSKKENVENGTSSPEKKDKKSSKKKLKNLQPNGDKEKSDTDDVPPEHADGRFSNFNIRESTINKLKIKGVKYLFPVQAQTYDKIYRGNDIIAKARTGTGKTLAFALPIIEKLETLNTYKVRGRAPKVLVLAPTRELASQVARDFQDLSTLSSHVFYGGVRFNEQLQAMRTGLDILIGTPGRVLDWVNKGVLDTTQLDHVVLDEVDQMLDMGFADDVDAIISYAYNRGEGKPNPQTLLFSATLPHWVHQTAKKYMKDNTEIIDLVGSQVNQTATLVTHMAVRCHWKDQASAIGRLIQCHGGDRSRVMVFCETKKDVNEMCCSNEIRQNKEKLHGDVPQSTREQVLQKFRSGAIKVLITTNVAARGLDIPEVDLVIQTAPPTDYESYIHRSGRTGRAGKSGVSICLYQAKSECSLINLERKAKISFKRAPVPSPSDLLTSDVASITSTLDSLESEVVERFRTSAKDILKDRSDVETVASLLAMLTGQTKVVHYSLINSSEGHVTFMYKSRVAISYKGYIYTMLRQRLDETLVNKVRNMTLFKDKMGAAFDVPVDSLEAFESYMADTINTGNLSKASQLPELESAFNEGGQVQQRNGWSRNFQQSRNRGNRFTNQSRGGFNNYSAGNKRKFTGQNHETANKKIKFS